MKVTVSLSMPKDNEVDVAVIDNELEVLEVTKLGNNLAD